MENLKIPHPAQISILEDTHRFRVACCGRRFGKTISSVEEMFSLAFLRTNQNIAYTAPTWKLAKEIAWEELVKRCREVIVNKNDTTLSLVIQCQDGVSTSKISLKSWEAVEDFLGQEFDLIVLDEVSKYKNFRYGWEEIIKPTLIKRKGQALFISTPNGKNHFYQLYQKELLHPDWKSFKFTSYDNPYLPHEELERERLEMPDDVFRQEYLAEFTQKVGLIYPEFKREKHILQDLPKDEVLIYKIAGVDFGFTVPSAIVYIGISQRKNFYILKEYYQKNKLNNELCLELSKETLEEIYPDPAEPDRIEEMRRFGLPVRNVNKDIEKGIDTIRTLLKTDRLFVLQGCENFVEEIEEYSWKENKEGEFRDIVANDQADHLLDALRYALYNYSVLGTQKYNVNVNKTFISKYTKNK